MSDRFGKFTYYGNPFIGFYARTNNSVTLISVSAPEKFSRMGDILGTKIVSTIISECPLIGLYCVMNSKGVLISNVVDEREIDRLKEALREAGSDINVARFKSNFTAIGNNIAVNDKGALINPDMANDTTAKEIADVLEVDIEARTIAGYKTVGAAVAATNKGFLAHPHISEDEANALKSLFGVDGGVGTVNGGMPFASLGIVANDKGVVFGESTTGFELHRIEESLGLIK